MIKINLIGKRESGWKMPKLLDGNLKGLSPAQKKWKETRTILDAVLEESIRRITPDVDGAICDETVPRHLRARLIEAKRMMENRPRGKIREDGKRKMDKVCPDCGVALKKRKTIPYTADRRDYVYFDYYQCHACKVNYAFARKGEEKDEQ